MRQIAPEKASHPKSFGIGIAGRKTGFVAKENIRKDDDDLDDVDEFWESDEERPRSRRRSSVAAKRPKSVSFSASEIGTLLNDAAAREPDVERVYVRREHEADERRRVEERRKQEERDRQDTKREEERRDERRREERRREERQREEIQRDERQHQHQRKQEEKSRRDAEEGAREARRHEEKRRDEKKQDTRRDMMPSAPPKSIAKAAGAMDIDRGKPEGKYGERRVDFAGAHTDARVS
jgi:hypothetical protein